ncbi:DUF1715-domain-containing protein [Tothia fuscella]|uniref:DUF1715-domain-containing protein n=1 Tax=Tothia fuscella TaxID=1048955 RepID=A0A9P4NS53_9PEZI|nr:DUF1715-domain-containing protein [Tothia fuscella]
MDEDWFDSVLNLEDEYYEEGYKQGVEDGAKAGRIEGRLFGLEKGFEKYVEMGKLNGKACVWAARMPSNPYSAEPEPESAAETPTQESNVKTEESRSETKTPNNAKSALASLPSNARLEKHIRTLYALTEAESLSTQNTEDSVSDFDDRFKRAVSKAKVIQNIIGERSTDGDVAGASSNGKEATTAAHKDRGIKITRATVTEKNMEDFGRKASSP